MLLLDSNLDSNLKSVKFEHVLEMDSRFESMSHVWTWVRT